MSPRLKLDLFHGMRVLAFVSFVTGISTFIVCGWTFLSNRLNIDSKFFANFMVLTAKLTQNTSNSSSSSSISTSEPIQLTSDPADVEVFDVLHASVVRCSIIVVLLVVVQIVSAAFIIGSSAQSCRARIKMWFVLNSGINVAILICLTMPLMYQIQHAHHLQITTLEMDSSDHDSDNRAPVESAAHMDEPNSAGANGNVPVPSDIPRINHLNSFYIGLGADFLVQFVTLISCLLLLKFNRHGHVNYEHVGSM